MNEPKRRTQRRTHLDASVVPVERALLARAASMEGDVSEAGKLLQPDEALNEWHESRLDLAREFRALADELHWW